MRRSREVYLKLRHILDKLKLYIFMKRLLFIAFLAIFALPSYAEETSIYLTKEDGTRTTQFSGGEPIYLEGTCPSAGNVDARIYIMTDKNWSSGTSMQDVSAGIEIVSVPNTDVVPRTKVWNAWADGAYDLVLDTNNNMTWELYEKCLLGETGAGFTIGSGASPAPSPAPAPALVLPPPPPPPAPAPVAATPPPPSQPSTAFSLDDYIEVKNLANVRKSPGGSTLGQQSKGQGGIIVGGPAQATVGGTSYWFWNINFDEDPDGWVSESTIETATKPKPVQETAATEPEMKEAVKILEETPREEKPAEKELAQVADSNYKLFSNPLVGAIIIGLAILLGLVLGSSIIAKALRREN